MRGESHDREKQNVAEEIVIVKLLKTNQEKKKRVSISGCFHS